LFGSLSAIVFHVPSIFSAYDSVIGVAVKFLSWATQLTVSFPLSTPVPTTTPSRFTVGLVVSTSIQSCGRSPICGGRSPRPTPERARSVMP
jgi:hypothetical protein